MSAKAAEKPKKEDGELLPLTVCSLGPLLCERRRSVRWLHFLGRLQVVRLARLRPRRPALVPAREPLPPSPQTAMDPTPASARTQVRGGREREGEGEGESV